MVTSRAIACEFYRARCSLEPSFRSPVPTVRRLLARGRMCLSRSEHCSCCTSSSASSRVPTRSTSLVVGFEDDGAVAGRASLSSSSGSVYRRGNYRISLVSGVVS